ncbi:MAG: DMT family transporter [candidate division WOR-3 bacterium]|nr:MAG: DMT family transporter [candidate division WOR-3 bacterium]
MTHLIGEFAALGTAFCWSFGSMFFTVSSRRLGYNVVNRVRLPIALVLLILAHLITNGTFVPLNVTTYHWFWFGLSGIVGFALGDMLLFKAFVMLGARLSMLLMALVPVFGTIIAWLFLNESLDLTEILAISTVITGIVWVISEKRSDGQDRNHYAIGILCGIGGAMGQALGLILSKKGLAGDYSALSGNIIRVFVALCFLWLITLIRGRVPGTIRQLKDRKGAVALFGGAFCGPFLGVWLSLVAVQNAYIGIACTLMALPPVFLIPLSHWFFKERIGLGAILGTIVAVIGVALIFLL